MNYFKRAIISIKRRPVKTTILLLLVFFLGSGIFGAISAERAINNTEMHLRSRMRPIVTIDLDEDALLEEVLVYGDWSAELVSPDTIRAIGNLPYVARFDYSIIAEINSELMRYRSGEEQASNADGIDSQWLDWFTIYGTSNLEPLIMLEGLIELASGNIFNEIQFQQVPEIHPAMISAGLAEVNNLTIGSMFTMEKTLRRPIAQDLESFYSEENIFAEAFYTFEVIGIFNIRQQDTQEVQTQQERSRINELSNTIITTNTTAQIIQSFSIGMQVAMAQEYGFADYLRFDPNELDDIVQTLIVLNDPLELDNFREAAESLLPSMWIVVDLSNTFARISNAMMVLLGISNVVLYGSIIAILLIIVLVIILFFKDRKHEIGVYLALGEKKSRIILQTVVESVIISLVGMTLAIFSGHFMSNVISLNMLRNEMQYSDFRQEPSYVVTLDGWNSLPEMGFARDLTIDEMMDVFEIPFDAQLIGTFYIIGLTIITLSTVIAVVYIIRLKPKEMLL